MRDLREERAKKQMLEDQIRELHLDVYSFDLPYKLSRAGLFRANEKSRGDRSSGSDGPREPSPDKKKGGKKKKTKAKKEKEERPLTEEEKRQQLLDEIQ